MTIILGCKTENAAWLLSDSAVTFSGPSEWPVSTFFETPRELPRGTVEEGALKIVQISESTIAAVCGELAPATLFVRAIRHHLLFGDRLTEIVDRAALYSGPWPPDTDFTVLVARSDAVHSELVSFDLKRRTVLEARAIDQSAASAVLAHGSLNPLQREHLRQALWLAVMKSESIEVSLCSILAVAQCCAAHLNMMDSYVGGVFAAACTSKGMVTWQPDVSHWMIAFDPTIPLVKRGDLPHRSIGRVFVFVRDGVASVHTEAHREEAITIPGIFGLDDPEQWWDRWRPDFAATFKRGWFRYATWLDVAQNNVIVLDQESTRGRTVPGANETVLTVADWVWNLLRLPDRNRVEVITGARMDNMRRSRA